MRRRLFRWAGVRKEYQRMSKYICPACGWTAEDDDKEYNHCPHCLSNIHEEDEEGTPCGGTYEPVSIWVKKDDTWDIIQRCTFCGQMRTVPMQREDNPVKMMSVAAQPLAYPPFPLEKMEELTKLMGGRGDMEGYYKE